MPGLLICSERLVVALLLGTLIGVEREWRHKTAGVKTNALVALGAALCGLLSAHGFGATNNPAQLAAAVITGIGFVGAGVIIHRGPNIQGVTTAATLWANASVGMAVGAGYVAVGSTVAALALIAQFVLRPLEAWIDRRDPPPENPSRIGLRVDIRGDAVDDVETIWESFASTTRVSPMRLTVDRTTDGRVWTAEFHILSPARTELMNLRRALLKLNTVTGVELRTGEREQPVEPM
jgi:uncharacterized membrane protein YhiD involved in acid resistance